MGDNLFLHCENIHFTTNYWKYICWNASLNISLQTYNLEYCLSQIEGRLFLEIVTVRFFKMNEKQETSNLLFFLLLCDGAFVQLSAKMYELNILERFEHNQKEGS